MNSNRHLIGLLGLGGKLTLKQNMLNYQHPYGRTFRVRVADIDSVTVDTVGFGKGKLKVIGKGSILAEEKMPITWANKCQDWILTQLNDRNE